MLAQIKQVGMTYLTQRYLWIGMAFFALFAIPNLAASANLNRANPGSLLFLLGMPMLMFLPLLVGQVKMQLAHTRARLIPNFLPAHITVVAGILVALMVLYPTILATATQVPALGLIALGLTIGVPAIWGGQLNRLWPMLISLATFYSLLTPAGLELWIANDASQWMWRAAIVVVGITLVVAWLRRICSLDEEMDDYQNNYQALLARRTGSEAIEQRRLVANAVGRNKLVAPIGDWWHRRLGGYYGGGKVGLIRLLRYGAGASPAEVNAIFMLAIFVAYSVFISWFVKSPTENGGVMGGVWFFVVFMIFIPGQMAGEMLAQRRPRIANELLLPLTRKQLVDGLISASAYNSLVVWLITNVGVGILGTVFWKPVSLGTVAMFLLLSASSTIAAMGVSLRTAVWPSRMKRFFVAWMSWIALVPPMILWWTMREKIGDAVFLIAAGLMMAIAAVLLSKARQAWLELELG